MDKKNRNNFGSLFGKISNLCKKKVNSVVSALDALCFASQQDDGRRAKACSFASQLAFSAQDECFEWVDKTIDFLIDSSEKGKWFSSAKSSFFLFALNISSGTFREVQLRVLGDYILSHEFPSNEEQLFDQFRILSVLMTINGGDREYYPSGAVTLLSRVLSEKNPLPFQLSHKARSVSIRLFTDLQQFKSVVNVYPEVVSTLIKGKDMEQIHSVAKNIQEDRINEILSKREYPPMIVQLEPRTFYKAKARTDAQKLKKQIRRETAAITRDVKKANEELVLKQYKENQLKKEKKERENRKVLALLNEQNNITLDVAAEEPKTKEELEAEAKMQEEEEEEEVEEEPTSKSTKPRNYDPDIGYEEDSEEEEDDD